MLSSQLGKSLLTEFYNILPSAFELAQKWLKRRAIILPITYLHTKIRQYLVPKKQMQITPNILRNKE